MFELISPSDHKNYKEKIESFLLDLKIYNPDLYKSFRPQNKATFILKRERSHQIQGGAILLQKKASSLHPDLQKHVKENIGLDQHVWVGTLYPHFQEEVEGHTFESLCKVFYSHLYESLLTFAVQEKTSFLCLTLDPCEQLSTELIGLWPYKVQVRHRESPDGLFHGVLSLTGNQNTLKGLAA